MYTHTHTHAGVLNITCPKHDALHTHSHTDKVGGPEYGDRHQINHWRSYCVVLGMCGWCVCVLYVCMRVCKRLCLDVCVMYVYVCVCVCMVRVLCGIRCRWCTENVSNNVCKADLCGAFEGCCMYACVCV